MIPNRQRPGALLRAVLLRPELSDRVKVKAVGALLRLGQVTEGEQVLIHVDGLLQTLSPAQLKLL